MEAQGNIDYVRKSSESGNAKFKDLYILSDQSKKAKSLLPIM